MTGNFRGKRLFAGRLFAGRLFGPNVPAFVGGARRRVQMPRWPADQEDDLLLLIAATLVCGAGALQ